MKKHPTYKYSYGYMRKDHWEGLVYQFMALADEETVAEVFRIHRSRWGVDPAIYEENDQHVGCRNWPNCEEHGCGEH